MPFSRLEAYDRNSNFGQDTAAVDENAFEMQKPELPSYKDINADSQVSILVISYFLTLTFKFSPDSVDDNSTHPVIPENL